MASFSCSSIFMATINFFVLFFTPCSFFCVYFSNINSYIRPHCQKLQLHVSSCLFCCIIIHSWLSYMVLSLILNSGTCPVFCSRSRIFKFWVIKGQFTKPACCTSDFTQSGIVFKLDFILCYTVNYCYSVTFNKIFILK